MLYLMERTKKQDYDLDKDLSLVGKTRGSVNDVNYTEQFEHEKRLIV